MNKNAEYETTLPRSALALALGALVGAMLVSAFVMASELGQPVPTLSAAIETAAWAFRYAFAVWVVGLAMIAPVPWLILHRMKYRTWHVAVILGAVLAFFVSLLAALAFLVDLPELMRGHANVRQLTASLFLAGLCGLSGAIVGIVVWRAAYYRHPAHAVECHLRP